MVMFISLSTVKLCTSTSERACAAQETNISQIREILESFNYDEKKLRTENQYLKTYIDIVKKYCVAYL